MTTSFHIVSSILFITLSVILHCVVSSLYTITLLYLFCPDVLSIVSETSQLGFIGSNEVLTPLLFIYLFIYLYLRFNVYTYLFNPIEVIF